MAFQFMHIEQYSRKGDSAGRTVDFVLAEASRRPDAIAHVASPKAPTVIYGATIDEVRSLHDQRVAVARVEVKGGGKARVIRQDRKTLHTVVMSHPATVAEARSDKAVAQQVLKWEALNIAWLRKQYGDDLVSVVRHVDEKQCHLHALVVPSSPGMNAADMHPGYVARRKVEASKRPDEDGKALTKRATAAYKAAMRGLQDDYHKDVAQPCGLTRLGPKGRRLTRAEWHAEKVQAEALKVTAQRAAVIQREARKVAERAVQVRHETKATLEGAKRYAGLGGRLRSMFDGLRVSAISNAIAAKVAGEIGMLKSTLETMRSSLGDEKARRRKSEEDMSAVRHSNRELVAQRDAARRELQGLRAALGFDRSPEVTRKYTP